MTAFPCWTLLCAYFIPGPFQVNITDSLELTVELMQPITYTCHKAGYFSVFILFTLIPELEEFPFFSAFALVNSYLHVFIIFAAHFILVVTV